MVAVLLSVTGGGVLLGSAVIARHQAQAIADLAALTGAASAPGGPVTACAQAGALARRMHAAEISCTTDGLDVVVVIAIPVPAWRLGSARAAARAGPPD
ncbi:flp pilus-assembly TadE/G-like family protein [Mycolicibacter hiberniae]|uniref:Uncharacterized protein n=2 Tax=Mycolicibacter hiberniae TaxID=29314 RepID=A0A7I7X5Z2_9MYCO|nr:flp pilus-assembly TadE/G-like family protein [Mycolicibacter hiberniae]ORV72236.1 helicase [Mycolicibacter hiberniae]BBZ24780.1 hypothetical protein MHIB_31980 [Mycolicibacter hiberniae]